MLPVLTVYQTGIGMYPVKASDEEVVKKTIFRFFIDFTHSHSHPLCQTKYGWHFPKHCFFRLEVGQELQVATALVCFPESGKLAQLLQWKLYNLYLPKVFEECKDYKIIVTIYI